MWLGHPAYLEIADGATVNYQRGQTADYDGRGFIAVDEVRFSDRPAPAASRPAGAGDAIDLDAGRSRCDRRAGRELADRWTRPRIATRDRGGDPRADAGPGDHRRHRARTSTSTSGAVTRTWARSSRAASSKSSAARLDRRARRGQRPARTGPADGRSGAIPLLPRVLVNRLWKHHFGEGIVRTPDDFGVMGRPPSHPELLDYLAARFVARGWSIKAMHRLMVPSSTYRMPSDPERDAERLDPTNELLHRMNVRRLEAEAIRDALLAVSGRLDPTMFGPSVPLHLTPFMDGRGRPADSGPLDGDGRRSLYLERPAQLPESDVPGLRLPVPFSTHGPRNVSNVPAQALTLMNDPFVIAQARLWAERSERATGPTAASGSTGCTRPRSAARRPTRPRGLAFLRPNTAAAHEVHGEPRCGPGPTSAMC